MLGEKAPALLGRKEAPGEAGPGDPEQRLQIELFPLDALGSRVDGARQLAKCDPRWNRVRDPKRREELAECVTRVGLESPPQVHDRRDGELVSARRVGLAWHDPCKGL